MKRPNTIYLRAAAALLTAGAAAVSFSAGAPARPTVAAATPSAVLHETPRSGTSTRGKLITVKVSTTVSADSANAVEADVTYAVSQMQYVSATVDQSVWGITAQKTGAAGKVRIAVGSRTPRTGTVAVATVTFRSLKTGSFRFGIGKTSAVMSATTNTNILIHTGTTSPPPKPAPPDVPQLMVCPSSDTHVIGTAQANGAPVLECNQDWVGRSVSPGIDMTCSAIIPKVTGEPPAWGTPSADGGAELYLQTDPTGLNSATRLGFTDPSGTGHMSVTYAWNPAITTTNYGCWILYKKKLAAGVELDVR